MPTTAPPCPQAARSPGIAPPPPSPIDFIVENVPVLPRPPDQAAALPNALVDPAIRWPYHLPSFNGVDCLWWAMLVRSMYASSDTWLRRVASWAGGLVATKFVGRSDPLIQGVGLVELSDQVLVVVPGTSSDTEALAYFLTHSLRLLYTDPNFGWQMNATWAARGQQVLAAYNNWPPPRPHKPVTFIGHSSGAGYSGYSVFTAFSDAHKPNTVVTFGAPIWGTSSLYSHYFDAGKLPKVIEFSVPNDPVVSLPPPWALIDLLRLNYALTDRISYQRFSGLLTLGENQAPSPNQAPSTTEALFSAALTVLTGQAIDADHKTAKYTELADRWAANDPSIAAEFLTPAYDALKAILVDMNTAGLY